MAASRRARAVGRILQVSVKPRTPGEHGLPKRAVPEARVTVAGVDGDHNAYRARKKADDPAMALLLMPVETLRDLAAEGWPVAPGDVGENVTTEGVPYEAFQPGTRWRLGTVEAEVTKPCDPCTNLYALAFVGPSRGPAFLKATLGRRGWYARVLREGVMRTGDAVERLS